MAAERAWALRLLCLLLWALRLICLLLGRWWRCLEALLLLLRCACSAPAPAPLLLAKPALLLQPLLELADFLLELLPFAAPAQHIIVALLLEPLAAPLLLLQAELAVATLLDLL